MKIYLVGGAVRDTLLKLPVSERDWVVVGASPMDLLARGFTQVGRAFPVFIHPKTGEEYALARTERKTGKGYTGFVCHSDPSVSLEEDLLRRDLTINAMAMDDNGQLIDPYNGQGDLAQRVLRHVSAAFAEDPLRVLRLARFAAKLPEFTIAPETLILCKTLVKNHELQTLPAERIWQECQLALLQQQPSRFFETLSRCDALDIVFPAIAKQLEADKTIYHAIDSAAQLRLATRQLPYDQGYLTQFSHTDVMVALLACKLPKFNLRSLACSGAQRQLSKLAAQWYPWVFSDDKDPAVILALFNQADAFRRHPRWYALLCVFTLLARAQDDSRANAKLLMLDTAFTAACGVNAQQQIKQGLEGSAIKAAIDKARLAVIRTTLTCDHG